eukprot:1735577-Rhodomonas_salina.1
MILPDDTPTTRVTAHALEAPGPTTGVPGHVTLSHVTDHSSSLGGCSGSRNHDSDRRCGVPSHGYTHWPRHCQLDSPGSQPQPPAGSA